MKKVFISLLAFSSILLLMLSSCKKDETKEYSSIGSAGTLSASTTTPVLSKETGDNTAVTFNWAATPVNGSSGTVTYTLQIDKKGNNFKLPREIAASGITTPVTQSALNKVLLAMGLPDGTPAQVETRLKSSIAPNVDAVYSNVITLTVTPYSLISYLYVPGGYQNWSPASAPTLASATSNGIYDGIISVPANTTDLGFKIATAPTWEKDNYGGAGGKLDTGGPNLNFPGTGTYLLHVDMNTLSYTITKQ